MLCITDQAYFDETMTFARSVGLAEQLQERIDWLVRAAKGRHTDDCSWRLRLMPDRPVGYHMPAEYNFYFDMANRQADGSYKVTMNGGLIFHGTPGDYRQGGSVQLSPSSGWSIHT